MEYIGWLYIATRLDAIIGCFIFIFAAGILGIFSIGISRVESGPYSFSPKFVKEFWESKKTFLRCSLSLIFVGILGIALVPSKNDAMFIAAGVGVIEGAKAVQGSEIAKKSVLIIEKWLDDQLKDTPQKKEK